MLKRFLFWILGVALGIAFFFGVVFGTSYALTGKGKLPDATVSLQDIALEPNGYSWNAPLIGGAFDKAFYAPRTLAVQKLGTLTQNHPSFSLPSWVSHSKLVLENESGKTVFEGTLAEYESFAFTKNESYKGELIAWHLPEGLPAQDYVQAANGAFVRNHGLEAPAQPSGWYYYQFRFTLDAAPSIVLSNPTPQNGAIVAMQIVGIMGDSTPVIETDLGDFEALPFGGGWRAYLPISYNTPSGEHSITVHAGDESVSTNLVVKLRNFGSQQATETPTASTTANAEYRNTIWPLYTQSPTPKAWLGRWICPLRDYTIQTDYGTEQRIDHKLVGFANCPTLQTAPDSEVFAPAGGTVVYAGELLLTGNTLVVDHGHQVFTYLSGLASLAVQTGDTLTQNQVIGTTTETTVLDLKIGNKSVCPWNVFNGQDGLFWQELP